jgi:hypothetical protein
VGRKGILMSENSLIDKYSLDVNALMSEDFDVTSLLDEGITERIGTLEANPLTEPAAKEIKDNYSIAEFIEGITTQRVNSPSATSAAMRTVVAEDESVGTWEGIKNSWRNGEKDLDNSEVAWEMMTGKRPIDYDTLDAITKGGQLETGNGGFIRSSVNAASNMLPMMVDTVLSGAKYALPAGATAAGAAVVGGQLGPQALTPEEVVTVPAAFATFGAIGFTYGSINRVTEIEGGLMFAELANMKDSNGSRLNKNSAIAISTGVGLLNGALELAQIDEIIKTIPGGKKILRKGIASSIRKIVKNKSLIKIAANKAMAYGKSVGIETLQELSQESVSIAGGELGKFLHNQANEGKMTHANADEIVSRLKQTGIESAKAFSVISLPGHVGGFVNEMIDNQGVEAKPKLEPDHQIKREVNITPRVTPEGIIGGRSTELISKLESVKPDKNGNRVMEFSTATEAIDAAQRIVDIAEERGVDVEVNTEAGKLTFKELSASITKEVDVAQKLANQTNKPIYIKDGKVLVKKPEGKFTEITPTEGNFTKGLFDKETIDTPTEEEVAELDDIERAEVEQVEHQVSKLMPATVKVKMYIGNVTQRMKKVLAGEADVDTKDISPFLDGAFPTKQTEVEMTSDEAMETLVMLEASLEQRLVDNLVNSENDLARANADWGDIKRLRESLELPAAKRPFTVHRAKYGVLSEEQVLGKIGVNPEMSSEIPLDSFNGTLNQRVKFSVRTALADTIKTTKIEQLNNVMRRMRKAAKEGYAEASKYYRELQMLRKQIQLRKKIVEQVKKQPSKGIDPFYAKAITDIQAAIDFKASSEKRSSAKESLKKHLKDNPGKSKDIPAHLLESLEKTDINELTLTEIQSLLSEIKRLSKLGKLKSKLLRKQNKENISAMVSEASESIDNARTPKLGKGVKAWTFRPIRILDLLDGVKDFKGKMVEMFDTAIQNAENRKLEVMDHRLSKGVAKRNELGITLMGLAKRRKISGVTLTVDDMIGVFAGWMNAESRAALKYGGIAMEHGESVKVTEDMYNEISNSLTNEEKEWASFIIAEYAEHWDRLRNARIEAENKDLGKVINYTKIIRVGVESKKKNDVLNGFDYSDETDYRIAISKADDKFTKERADIPDELQLPLDTSLTRIWMGEVRKQEHYIALAKLLKDLQSVVNNEQFKDKVTDKFGDKIYASLSKYLNRVADPDFYRNFDDIENVSRALRKNVAVAYLAYNVLTVAKQAPSLMLYSMKSSFSDLLMSATQVAAHPKQTYEAVLSHNPQIGHAAISREIEELKHSNKKLFNKIVSKVGLNGLRGIYEIDRAVRVIGENAVINKQMREGASLEEASKTARQTTLRTQPAAGAKDIAQIYAQNETLNWFLMFTNQLNQLWNIAAHDIPGSFLNKNYADTMRSSIAMATVAAWIWMLQNKEIPDEPSEILDSLVDQSLGSIPIIGGSVLSGKHGWGSSAPAPLNSAAKISKALTSGDTEQITKALLEGASLSVGAPYVGMKRVYETAAEKDLWELIGGKD